MSGREVPGPGEEEAAFIGMSMLAAAVPGLAFDQKISAVGRDKDNPWKQPGWGEIEEGPGDSSRPPPLLAPSLPSHTHTGSKN